MIKVKEMINEPVNGPNIMTQTHSIIFITAFLFDIYIYCYKKGCSYTNCFLPPFVEFWTKELFLKLFKNRFKKYGAWQNLREHCKRFSEKYDKTGAEKSTNYFEIVQFNPKYFENDVNKIAPGGHIVLPKFANESNSADSNLSIKVVKVPDSAHCKLISRFHTVSGTSEKTLSSNYRFGIRKRQETLHIIVGLSKEQDFLELDGHSCVSVIEEKESEEKSQKNNPKKRKGKNK